MLYFADAISPVMMCLLTLYQSSDTFKTPRMNFAWSFLAARHPPLAKIKKAKASMTRLPADMAT